MVSGAQGQGPSTSGPPYAPQNFALGGVPDVIPDIPITAVFLFLYVVFAIVHFVIMKKGQKRGHKFVFSGALFGFCKIRIITMSMRIAWACHNRNISLGIAATIFVYVGTVILYIVNWFFTQRIIRAQHPRWGWSMPYRVLHRVGLVCLILTLLMLIVGGIQMNFTLNPYVLHIDRALQLTGQTYFGAFCIAPLVLIAISHILPRRGTEKFGAGRLRINIAIVVVAVIILSIGQVFRTTVAWLPLVKSHNAQGQSNPTPWYFSKACFYTLNFTTEIVVVIFYALARVDLRFHIPDGAKQAGDYAKGRQNDGFHIDVLGNEKNLKRASTAMWIGQQDNASKETLQEFEGSVFDDSKTLADSLRYPSSVLEVDQKTGHWKIKRMSANGSIRSSRASHLSEPSLWSPDRDTYVAEEAPPVPAIPTDWPLRESQISRGYGIPRMEHQNRSSRSALASSNSSAHELRGHSYNNVDMSDAIADAIAKLEANSELNKRKELPSSSKTPPPPDYDAITPIKRRSGSDIPKKHVYKPPTPPSMSHSRPASDLPKKQNYAPSPRVRSPRVQSPLVQSRVHSPQPPSIAQASSRHLSSRGTDAQSFGTAEEEFKRFSYEAPLREGDPGYEPSLSENDKEMETRGRQLT